MSRRRLAIGVVAVATALLGGRALSVVFESYSWYDSLGARAVWIERAMDTSLIVGTGFIFAMLFALLNFAVVRRGVGSVTRPRKLANVRFGEAVPPGQLRAAAILVSAAIALALTRLLPSWKAVALARLGVDFREADPYLQRDISFYATWLPLERSLYSWTLGVVVSVAAVVIALYAFSSAIRWSTGVLRFTPPGRRHLGILAAILLLICAWSYRLDSYELLTGDGHGGTGFGYLDREWMLPALLALSLATVASAITVAISAWMGQLRTSMLTIMLAVGLAAIVKEVLPLAFHRASSEKLERTANEPYRATRADFTRRAFGAEIDPGSDISPFDSFSTVQRGSQSGADTLVGPGATGALLVDNPTLDIAAPSVGTGLSRLAHAWAARDFRVLSDSVHRRTRVVAVRDVRERVMRLYPLFFVGPGVRPLFHADTLYWSVPLFSSSASYPLAESRAIWRETRSYFHRAGTALVNGRTGRVYAALDIPPEPIAAGWIRKFESPASIAAARSVQHTLSINTRGFPPAAGNLTDTSFRAGVVRLYDRMRSALSAGDLRGFGLAYDSLGALVRSSGK